MNAVLVRHPRVHVPPGLCYGWCDVPLAEGWRTDLAEVRRRLPWQPEEVWTSPSARCLALAETLGGERLVIEPRLRELHMGTWEGRRWEDFRGPESEAWALDPWRQRPPGGETAEELWSRVGAVRTALHARPEVRVAVVAHAGVIRAWRGLAEGRTLGEMMGEPVAFGSIFPAR